MPHSYLWILDPCKDRKDTQKQQEATDYGVYATTADNPPPTAATTCAGRQALLRAAQAAGVSANRIVFAPRVDKASHIYRHAAADLFLDTLVYGAHSTATDALRGVSA